MTRLFATRIAALTLFALAVVSATKVDAQDLSTFGVLGGSAVTNVISLGTVINGNVGVSPGSSITGFPPGLVNAPFAIHNNDAVAAQVQSELTTLYNSMAGRPTTADLTGQDLGGLVLTPGVYAFSSTAQLTGTLTLNGQGNPNALFVFNIGSALTTASASSVLLINGAQGANVYFRVGSDATLGTTSQFAGNILALTSISLNTDANINCGSALARNAAVTLDSNEISICTLVAATFASVLGPSATANQRAVADAIDAFIAAGGTLPAGFQNLLDFLSPDQLLAAFTQLSGEPGSGVSPAGTQAMSSFLSLLNSRFDDDSTAPGDDTVEALGYAPGDAPLQTASAFASFDNASFGFAPGKRRWDVWAAAYGGYNFTAGDPLVGSHDRSAGTVGLAVGLDYRLTPDTRVGFALAGGGTSFGLSNSLGGGSSDMFQAAFYSRTNFDAAYVATALAYAWHGVTTDRYVTVAGTDHLHAAFSAHSVAGEIEGGYRLGWITPYAALRVQAFHTPAYSESAVSGSSIFALDYSAHTTLSARTELGAKFDRTMAIHDGATLALRARAAWAHDFGSNTSAVAMFQALPGSNFTVQGAAPGRDSLLFSAGAEVGFDNGFSLAGSFDSEFALGAQTYVGTGRVRYTW